MRCTGSSRAISRPTESTPGFGRLCTKRISPDQIDRLQHNLIISHAVGDGTPVPSEIVRWIMLPAFQALCDGVSGISPTTMKCLLRLPDADVLPAIPTQG